MRLTTLRARGFSIVELMIAIAIGMLALALSTRLITGSESAKASALGTSDSMQNGMLAMFSISADAQQAGFGLNDPLLIGCNTRLVDRRETFVLQPALRGTATIRPLTPALIQSNGEDPDVISLYSGSSPSGTGTTRLIANYIGGGTMMVDGPPYGFAAGDVVVVAPEDRNGDCALTQVAVAPTAAAELKVASGTYRYNDGNLGRNFDGGATRIFKLGPEASLSFHTWSVDKGFLKLRATDMAGSGSTPAPVADNIVSIKAQYGFDTRSAATFAARTGLNINSWSASMIDANGDGVTGSAGDYERIAALRIAVVARSKTRSMPAGSGTCNATSNKPQVFATAEPSGVTAVPMTVNVAVSGEAANSWRCYRYRVFETIVPLRNAFWRP